jgi:threonine dehydratase
VARTGAAIVHPYNDFRVIAGQGTAAYELCTEVPDLDMVLAPVGGGGLLSGTAIAVTSLNPDAAVVAAEPAAADDAWQSFRAGRLIPAVNPVTVADGLRTSLGTKTFPIIKRLVTDIITVKEADIVQAMRLMMERMKVVVEPSAAVPLGAVLGHPDLCAGRRVGIIVSGGNVDLSCLPWQ